jgi:hypothetical protein
VGCPYVIAIVLVYRGKPQGVDAPRGEPRRLLAAIDTI